MIAPRPRKRARISRLGPFRRRASLPQGLGAGRRPPSPRARRPRPRLSGSPRPSWVGEEARGPTARADEGRHHEGRDVNLPRERGRGAAPQGPRSPPSAAKEAVRAGSGAVGEGEEEDDEGDQGLPAAHRRGLHARRGDRDRDRGRAATPIAPPDRGGAVAPRAEFCEYRPRGTLGRRDLEIDGR